MKQIDTNQLNYCCDCTLVEANEIRDKELNRQTVSVAEKYIKQMFLSEILYLGCNILNLMNIVVEFNFKRPIL